MKKTVYILLASVCLAGFVSSCSDFLQKDPPASPSQSIYWQKKSDFDSALAGCYSLVYEWPGVMSQIIACFDNLTDNSICQYDEDTYGKSKTIALGDITPQTSGYVSYMYKHCYMGIARVHLVMENLAKYTGADIPESDRKFMLAQCKALRGYFYSWLYRCYREVPLVTESLTTDNMYKEKSSREAILTQIIQDYDEAIAGLPDRVYSDPEVSGRFSAGAVKALKARLLLDEAYDAQGNPAHADRFKEVAALAESVGGYSLAPRMRDNFLSDKQLSSPEIIFSVRFLKPNILHSMDLYYGAWATCQVTRDLVDEFECSDGLKWGESPLTEKIDEAALLDGNTDVAKLEREKLFKNRDRRLYETVSHSNFPQFPDEGFEGIDYTWGDPETHFNMIKLVNPSKEQIGYSTISDADVVIVRYAEVLLMLAEAENEVNGPTPKVYNAVNEVRMRSDMPKLPEGLTKEQMRERIRHEWRVEFAFEGQRYFQLKRWKLMEEKVNGKVDPAIPTYQKVFHPEFYYWPLPQSEIDKAGGVLTQDPNYK